MSMFEINKIFAAILVGCLIAMVSALLARNLVVPSQLDKPVYEIAAEGAASGADEKKADAGPPYGVIGPLLASADVAKGEKVFKKCTACHTPNEGGSHKTGPNLWDIVDRDKAAPADFKFSATLNDMEGVWDYEALNAFLYKPKAYVKGTKMGFAGLKKPADRANVIMYLRSLSATPAPLP